MVQAHKQKGGNPKNVEQFLEKYHCIFEGQARRHAKPPEVSEKFFTLIGNASTGDMSLDGFRKILEKSIKRIGDNFKASKAYKNAKIIDRQAYDLFFKYLSVDVLTAYAAHEVAPHGKPKGKLEYLENGIREYGEIFLTCRPSEWDKHFSAGAFQFTQPAVTDVHRLGKSIGIEMPEKLEDYTKFSIHSEAAVLYALDNFRYLIMRGKNTGGNINHKRLVKLLEYEAAKNKEAFIAGIVGLMHNSRLNAKYILYFLEEGDRKNIKLWEGDIAKNAMDSSFSGGDIRKKYFEEAVLIHSAIKKIKKKNILASTPRAASGK